MLSSRSLFGGKLKYSFFAFYPPSHTPMRVHECSFFDCQFDYTKPLEFRLNQLG